MRFLLYDRIIEMEMGKRALATKLVPMSEEYFPEHYSRRAVMPATLIIEAVAQLAGWLNVASCDFKIETALAMVEGVQIHRQVRPGDSLILEVWMLYPHHDGATLRGEVRMEKKIIAAVDRLVFGNRVSADKEHASRERERFRYLSGEFQERFL